MEDGCKLCIRLACVWLFLSFWASAFLFSGQVVELKHQGAESPPRETNPACNLYPENWSKQNQRNTVSPFSTYEMTGVDLAQEFLESRLTKEAFTVVQPIDAGGSPFRKDLNLNPKRHSPYYEVSSSKEMPTLGLLLEEKPFRTSLSSYLAAPPLSEKEKKAEILIINSMVSFEAQQKLTTALEKYNGFVLLRHKMQGENVEIENLLTDKPQLTVLITPANIGRINFSKQKGKFIFVPYMQGGRWSWDEHRDFALNLVAGVLADAKTFFPEASLQELQIVLDASGNSNLEILRTAGGKALNAYRLMRVLDRLKAKCKNQPFHKCVQSLGGSNTLFDFKDEANTYFKEAESLLAQLPPSCESRKRAFQLVRKAHFLEPTDEKFTDTLATLYGEWGFLENEDFYRYQDDVPKRFSQMKEWLRAIEYDERYGDEFLLEQLIERYKDNTVVREAVRAITSGTDANARKIKPRALMFLPYKDWPKQVDDIELERNAIRWLNNSLSFRRYYYEAKTTPKEVYDLFNAVERKWEAAAALPEQTVDKYFMIEQINHALAKVGKLPKVILKNGREVNTSAVKERLMQFWQTKALHSPSATVRFEAADSILDFYDREFDSILPKKYALLQILRKSNDERVLTHLLNRSDEGVLSKQETIAVLVEREKKGDETATKILKKIRGDK